MSSIILPSLLATCASGVVLREAPVTRPAGETNYKTLRFVPAIDPYDDDPTFPEKVIDWRILQKDTRRDREAPWMPEKGPLGGPFWHDRLLVWPEKKFAFCYVEKNACTQFNHLMNFLNGLGTLDDPWWKSAWFQYAHEGGFDFDSISTANGWKLAMFARDPAERFLSAWASKCVDWEDFGVNCLGTERLTDANESEKVDAFEDMVRNKSRKYEELRHRDHWWNAHYDPQSSFCGLEASRYTFIGRLSGNFTDVHNQVYHMIKNVAGADPDHPVYAGLNRLFPRDRMEGHHTDSARRMELYFRKPEIYDIVANIFAKDYERFGFTQGTYAKRYV